MGWLRRCSRPGRCGAGFTLVEMLTVIAIIAVLVGLLLPVLAMAKRHANNAATKAAVKTLETSLNNYRMDANTYPIKPGGSNKIHLGSPGYYTMKCVALDTLTSGAESNKDLIKLLSDTQFLRPGQTDIDKSGNIIDRYATPLIVRFLVLSSDPTATTPDKLEEVVYIWSYGFDRKNHVNAAEDYTYKGAPAYDQVESDNIKGSPDPTKTLDDVVSW